jgi:hypothetical protein
MGKCFFMIVIVASSVLDLNCNSATAPNQSLTPGRRDYVWTVDTLPIPPGDIFYPTRVWGSSANDVWLVGTGSPSYNLIWHFNGSSWKKDSASRQINPYALWGFASNNVWLGNLGNSIWRYDGNQWYKYSDIIPPNGFYVVDINGIWGIDPFDVWAVGAAQQTNGGTEYEGILMHFIGGSWEDINIPSLRIGFTDLRQEQSTGIYFLYGWRFEPTGDTCKVYSYDGKDSVKEIYSSANLMTISEIQGEVYFVAKKRIYKYVNSELLEWKDFNGANYLGWMVGRTEWDFFGVGRNNGDIVHYNGSDLATLYHNSTAVWDVFLVDNAVFYVCEDVASGVCSIIHGILP